MQLQWHLQAMRVILSIARKTHALPCAQGQAEGHMGMVHKNELHHISQRVTFNSQVLLPGHCLKPERLHLARMVVAQGIRPSRLPWQPSPFWLRLPPMHMARKTLNSDLLLKSLHGIVVYGSLESNSELSLSGRQACFNPPSGMKSTTDLMMTMPTFLRASASSGQS